MAKAKKTEQQEADDFDLLDPFIASEEEMLAGLDEKKREAAYAEIDRRGGAYARVFGGADKRDVEVVMKDLAWFCRLYKSAYRTDPRDHALLEGRREVAQRIMDFTRLDREALFKIYTGSQ